jgi:hypothetical protein
MEAHVAEDVLVTEKDVNRVEHAIKSGNELREVFPRLESVGTVVEGVGVELTVRFSKREGIPVRFVHADDPREAAAVREIDLERKYHLSARILRGASSSQRPGPLPFAGTWRSTTTRAIATFSYSTLNASRGTPTLRSSA